MKESRQYGLFKKEGGKWIRLHPAISAKKSAAVRIFQDAMLKMATEGVEFQLRPITERR